MFRAESCMLSPDMTKNHLMHICTAAKATLNTSINPHGRRQQFPIEFKVLGDQSTL